VSNPGFDNQQWAQQEAMRLQRQEQERQQQQQQLDQPRRQQLDAQAVSQHRKSKLRGRGWRPAGPEADEHVSTETMPVGTGGGIVGVARAVQQRAEQSSLGNRSMTIWTFRVERYDAEGHALPPIPVEMRGANFKGVVTEGDWVEVGRKWSPGRVVHTRSVRNLTTGGELRRTGLLGALFGLAIFLVFLVIFIVFVIAIWKDKDPSDILSLGAMISA